VAVATLAAASLGTMLMTTPANASTTTTDTCKTSSKKFNLPNKPDVTVNVKICLTRTINDYGRRMFEAEAYKVSWSGSNPLSMDRFNKFSVKVQVERYNKYKVGSNSVSFASDINHKSSGSDYPSNHVYAHTDYSTLKNGWTTDGIVKYDITGDGKGTMTWDLAGTARLA
jgi:hypothetical protein